jgi:tetratricopeptide (TPR) repeat protein
VTVPFKYRAFLSYSHRDAGWAKWLHGRLEAFHFDKYLVGRETSVGPVPRTLRPIFRDREDFSGGHTLTGATVAALDASAALIVLCSPIAASRPAVNEEVRLFRSRHPDRPVIPVIIEGTVPDNLPPALRFELAADGSVTDRPITILGPDLREAADGKTLGVAKTIAGLTGLSADDVFRRAERARRRQRGIWGGFAAFCLLLAILASGSAVYAWQQLKTNEAFLSATLKTATDIVDTAVAQAEKYRVPRAATLELLNKAEGLFDDMARYGRPTPELQYQKAWMLIQFARNYAALGDSNKEHSRAEDAYHLLAGLVAAKPKDTEYQRGLAAAYEEVGDVQVKQGDLAAAVKSFSDSLAIRKGLAQSDPGNARWQRILSLSLEKVGDVQMAQGDLAGALKSYGDRLAIMQRLVQSDHGNAGWQRDLSASYSRVGNAQMAQGDLADALKSYGDSLAIIQRLAQSDPGNAGWQRDLSVCYGKLGDVFAEQGDIEEAIKNYRLALGLVDRLIEIDSTNVLWQDDLVEYNYNLAALGDDADRRTLSWQRT